MDDTDYGALVQGFPTRDSETQGVRMHRRELAENLAKTIAIYKQRQEKAKENGHMPPNWLEATVESLERQHLELITELEDEAAPPPDNHYGAPAWQPWVPWLIAAVAVALLFIYRRYF